LYAIQVLTNRGRASTFLTLPANLKAAFTFNGIMSPSAHQICNRDGLRQKLEKKLDVLSKKSSLHRIFRIFRFSDYAILLMPGFQMQFTGARIMKWLRFSRSEWYCVYPLGTFSCS
jgi:hypothetical protein